MKINFLMILIDKLHVLKKILYTNTIKILIVIVSFLMLQGCQEGTKSAKTIECAPNSKCLVDTKLASKEQTQSLYALFESVSDFYHEFPATLLVLHESSAKYADAFAEKKDNKNYIYFGEELYTILNKNSPENSNNYVLGVLSHEYAHIMQYNVEINSSQILKKSNRQLVNIKKSVILSELEADAFSGYFMYTHLQERDGILQYIEFMGTLGDNQFESSKHHGTSQQRKEAVEIGIVYAKSIADNNIKYSFRKLRYKILKRIKEDILYLSDYE